MQVDNRCAAAGFYFYSVSKYATDGDLRAVLRQPDEAGPLSLYKKGLNDFHWCCATHNSDAMDSEAISIPLFMGPLLLLVCVGLMYVAQPQSPSSTGSSFLYSLFGTFCCQVYVYWYAYDEDPKFLKSYVFVVLYVVHFV